jgi:hypothetical protein
MPKWTVELQEKLLDIAQRYEKDFPGLMSILKHHLLSRPFTTN